MEEEPSITLPLAGTLHKFLSCNAIALQPLTVIYATTSISSACVLTVPPQEEEGEGEIGFDVFHHE